MQEGGITFCNTDGRFHVKGDCSIAEFLLFGEIVKVLQKDHSMEYLEKNPELIVMKYNQALLSLDSQVKVM